MLSPSFQFFKQRDSMDCGPTCLKMIAQHYGKSFSLPYLRELCYIDRAGVSAAGIINAATTIELKALVVKIPFEDKKGIPSLTEAPLPAILHWNQNHFIVVYAISRKYIFIADPADGKYKLRKEQFLKAWLSDGNTGVAILFEPTVEFNQQNENVEKGSSLRYLTHFIQPHRILGFQLILGMIVAILVQLILPFLTQSLVDIGIDTKNISFIYIVLIAQVAMQIFNILTRFLQSWVLLHISTRINVRLIDDFLFKLMKLPLNFFESKSTGDLMQRISDQKRIQSFLTDSLLNMALAILNLIVFGILLVYYSIHIFFIFAIAAVLYIVWVTVFLRFRKEIDYLAFQQMSDNQESLLEIIQGMPEIKLQGSQQKRRSKWASIQAKLFRLQGRSLAISQYQDGGAMLINQLKDIIISVIAAIEVMEGRMTLGMMLAVQYVIGQLNGPINQMIGFLRDGQDAKISLDRLMEVNQAEDEEKSDVRKINFIPQGPIEIKNLSYRYSGISDDVLMDVNMQLPRGKTTAIVGASGSGKTTLIKLLLQFDKVKRGSITIGGIDLASIYLNTWRSACGAVLQDGFIFSDTISNNVAESDEQSSLPDILSALNNANILNFVKDLPMQSNTLIGAKGSGLSQGQKQRLLIARALYKNPEFLFLDEATNALDATNEREIIENLKKVITGKTTIVVAHRLSTVKHADQIIVLDKGRVVETGTHTELVRKEGHYFTLVSNQLELGI